MSIIDHTTKEIDLLARLMRAEAVGEGELGMLMVGNVGVNRVLADCLDFPTIRSITNMIYQSPGGFTGTNSPLFQSAATTMEKRLAEEVLMGRTYYPATHALWFYAPKTGEACRALWFNQRNSGRYKNHCFYRPDLGICPQLIR